MSLYDKKTKGIYYTPKIIVDYILEELLINYDIIKNPEPKILDLSCGCGNFLLEAFDILYKLIKTNLKAINEKYGEHYIDNISTHIITKCIYGTDLDTNAIEILKETLVEKKRFYDNQKYDFFININNITCEDGLKKNYNIKFDYIIGNPPYIGHKILDKNFRIKTH